MMRRILLISLFAVSLVSCTNNAALDTDQTPRSRYTGDVGESPVGVIPEGALRDNARNRSLGIAVEYPTRPGPHPLIIFSHGFGAAARDYAALGSFWASQGYVVVRPMHADAGRATSAQAAQTAFAAQTAADRTARAQDVRVVLDSLDLLEQTYPELQGKIDRARVGVAGHSYGALTAMLVGGATTTGGTAVAADPRVRAIVALGPPGIGETRGITEQSFAGLAKPVLFIVGSAEQGANETETPEWRRRAFELAPAGDKWLVTLEGGMASAYTGRIDAFAPTRNDQLPPTTTDPDRDDPNRNPVAPPVVRPQQQRGPNREGTPGLRTRGAFATVKALSLAFFDTYLRENAEGRTALEAAGSRGGVTLERR